MPRRCCQTGPLQIVSEQALNRESRVELGEQIDRFRLRQVVLDWRISEIDVRTMRRAAILWAGYMAEQDLGRVRLVDWVHNPNLPLPSLGDDWMTVGRHHMCTTRMSSNPREGVVDATCRVHDVANLYLGGSSVFATAGHSNPTYTIVQLALRLADHLTMQVN